MDSKKYYDLGMSVLDTLSEYTDVFESNRSNVVEFIERLSDGHLNTVLKYGSSQALNAILLGEIISFYTKAMGLPEDFVAKLLRMKADILISENDVTPKDCLIVYPSFSHEKKGLLVTHVPTIRGYMLDAHYASLVNVDYESCEKKEGLTNEAITATIKLIAEHAAKEWTKGHALESGEMELIEDEIFAVIVLENTEACKEDIINYLDEVAAPGLVRLLEDDKETYETPLGTCTQGTGYLGGLIAQYVAEEEVEKFKRQFMSDFGSPDKKRSPQYLEEYLISYGDKDIIEGKEGYFSRDAFIWHGDRALDLSKMKHHPTLKDYTEIIKGKEGYFKIQTPTLIRCSVKSGRVSFEVSDLMPIISPSEEDRENISFQTSRAACTKDEFFNCLQTHLDYCLENDLVPENVAKKIILTTKDKWFNNYNANN